MEFKIVIKKNLEICGLQTELTTSQQENHKIITKHWQVFNNKLSSRKINSGENWKKFGITTKKNNRYFYLSAISIPAKADISSFTVFNMAGGKFACFHHKGKLEFIKSTIHNIYKNIIPMSNLKIDKKRFLIHYEQYDNRFHWNKTDSVIDIFVPIIK